MLYNKGMNDRKFFLLAIALENATQTQLDALVSDVITTVKKYTKGGNITDQHALTREISKLIDRFYYTFVDLLHESAKKVGDNAAQKAINEMIPLLNSAGLYREGIKLYQEIRDYGERVAKRLMVDGWSGQPLSYTIKTIKAGTQKTVQNIIANGSAEGKSAFDIAKRIEQYLNPIKNGATVAPYEEYRKRFGRPKSFTPKGVPKGSVQYNAYRIARTEMAHISRTAVLDFYEDKEFVKGYSWHLSNRHKETDICDENAKKTYETRDDIPTQHPNCLCDIRAIPMTRAELAAYRRANMSNETIMSRAIKISKELTRSTT